jgi:peptide/nickel transport system substrate-binding protein
MDPHLGTLPQHIIYENVYDGLLALELTDAKTWEHKVTGVLAESWEQKDSKTLVFKLRTGVKFHDGSDFDAETASWNILRARDHPKSQLKASLAAIDTVTAVDKSTLEIKTKTDNAALLRTLAFTNGGLVRMVSKVAFDKNGEEWLQRNPVGTGAFKFKQWITDDRVTLERNPEYFVMGLDGKTLPYLDGLVLRYIPDPSVSTIDMRAGSIQFLEWVAFKDVETIRQDSNLAMTELPWAGQIYFMVAYNTETPPFNDVRVRQAANYAIDRVTMHKLLGFGVGQPYDYPYWTPGTLGHDDNIRKYTYNPAKAKELLKEAGYPDGVTIELKVIAREPENTIGEYVQQMWSEGGIKTRLVSQERLSWIDAVRAKNFQSCFWRGALWAQVDPELARTLITTGGPTNWSQFSDKDVDRLLDEGLATLDPKKRADIYRQMWEILQERAYAGTGFLAPVVNAYRKDIQGLTFNFMVPNMTRVWLG